MGAVEGVLIQFQNGVVRVVWEASSDVGTSEFTIQDRGFEALRSFRGLYGLFARFHPRCV